LSERSHTSKMIFLRRSKACLMYVKSFSRTDMSNAYTAATPLNVARVFRIASIRRRRKPELDDLVSGFLVHPTRLLEDLPHCPLERFLAFIAAAAAVMITTGKRVLSHTEKRTDLRYQCKRGRAWW